MVRLSIRFFSVAAATTSTPNILNYASSCVGTRNTAYLFIMNKKPPLKEGKKKMVGNFLMRGVAQFIFREKHTHPRQHRGSLSWKNVENKILQEEKHNLIDAADINPLKKESVYRLYPFTLWVGGL